MLDLSPHHTLRLGVTSFLLTTCALCTLWYHAPGMAFPSPLTLLLCTLPGMVASATAPRHARCALPLLAVYAGILFASARVHATLPSPVPVIASASSLTSQFIVEDLPSPTPHGWRVRLHDPGTSRTYLATIPADRLDDPDAPPLPGSTLHADLTVTPTPARHSPDIAHPTTRLAMARAHAYARVESFEVVERPQSALMTRHVRARHALIARVRAILPEKDAAMVLAMTLGIKTLLPDHLREPFGVTGTAHLLAISGLHLGTLAALMIALIKWLGAPLLRRVTSREGLRALTHPGVALLLTCYVWLIGAPTSARRALTMLLCLMCAYLIKRRLPPLTILMWATGVLCLINPLHVLEPGFWLSVCATGAILLVMRRSPLSHAAPVATWRTRCVSALKVSVAAWLGTAPVVIAISHELPTIGVPLNMVLVPLVSALIFPVMVCGVLLCVVSPELAAYPLHWSVRALELCAAASDQVAMWQHATWRPGHLPLWLVVCCVVLVFTALERAARRPRQAACLILVAVASVASHHAWMMHAQRGTLRVDFIDVGQGDATLVTFPDGATMLVDAGGRHVGRDPGAARVVPWLRYRGISELDTMVLTHADVDHMRGLFAVLRRVPPRQFIASKEPDSHEFTRLTAALSARDIPVVHVPRSFDQAGVRVLFHVLDDPELGRNDRSIVIELHYKGASILLPGDIERPAELAITPKLSSPVTLIKMPHHGSHSSSTPELLAHTRPRVAIASCGLHNRFGHPRADVLARYAAHGTDVWRTDHHGTITATIDQDGQFTIAHPVQQP